MLDDSCTVWKMHSKRSGMLSMGAQGCGGNGMHGKECKAQGTVHTTFRSCTCKQAHDTCACSACEQDAGALSSRAGMEEVEQVIE